MSDRLPGRIDGFDECRGIDVASHISAYQGPRIGRYMPISRPVGTRKSG
jgi:hypothetical protein